MVLLHAFCRLLIFLSKIHFSKNDFGNTISVSNSLDLDQNHCFVRVQTVCKGDQQAALVGKELKVVETHNKIICIVYCNTRIKSHRLIGDAQIKFARILVSYWFHWWGLYVCPPSVRESVSQNLDPATSERI